MGLFDRDRGDEQKTEQQEAEEPLRRDEMEEQGPKPSRDEEPAREQSEEGGSTAAAVKREPEPAEDERRKDDPDGEYQWHTGRQRPHGEEDAVEFVEVHKAFGRNKILRGLNLSIPEDKISMILGPSGTGKSVCIKHMVGLDRKSVV